MLRGTILVLLLGFSSLLLRLQDVILDAHQDLVILPVQRLSFLLLGFELFPAQLQCFNFLVLLLGQGPNSCQLGLETLLV